MLICTQWTHTPDRQLVVEMRWHNTAHSNSILEERGYFAIESLQNAALTDLSLEDCKLRNEKQYLMMKFSII